MSRLLVTAIIAALLAGCGSPYRDDPAESLAAADREAGSLEGVLAPDVHYLAPGLPVIEGREAVARELDAADSGSTRRPLVIELSADGSQGFTAGRTTVPSGDSTRHGKYLAYWRRDPEGWRLWAIVANPSPSAPDTPPDSGVARARGGGTPRAAATPDALETADSAFSALSESAGVGPAFREFAEPAALTLMGPGHGMVWGDSAIGAYFGSAIPATDGLAWTPRVAHLAPSGDLGFTIGDAIYRHAPAGGPEQRFYTKYLTVWRRQADGRWRYAADGGNDQPAPSDRGSLRASWAADGLHLVNPDTADAFYIVFEQGITALVNWRPCVDREGCRYVPGRGARVMPRDSVPGFTPSADSVTVFWWRPTQRGGRSAFDSVRSRTLGVR